MKNDLPDNVHTKFGVMIEQICAAKGLPLPMATEFNMIRGSFRLHMNYDERIARHLTASAKVVMREILDALDQKDVELAKTMIKKEISLL